MSKVKYIPKARMLQEEGMAVRPLLYSLTCTKIYQEMRNENSNYWNTEDITPAMSGAKFYVGRIPDYNETVIARLFGK